MRYFHHFMIPPCLWLLLCAPLWAAGEFQLLDKSLSGRTVYALLFSGPGEADAGEAWAPGTATWEPLTDTWADFDIALTEVGTTGNFLGNMPAIGNKSVRWVIYQDANDDATPDSAADIPLAEGYGFWDTTHFAIRIVDGIGTGELDTASGTVIVGSFEDDAITGLSIQDGAFEATKFAAGLFESLLDFMLDDGTEVYDRTTDSMQAKRDLFNDAGTLDTLYTGSALETDVLAVKTKTDFLPSITAGAAGGLFIAGTNAQTTITGGFGAGSLTNLSFADNWLTGPGVADSAATKIGAAGSSGGFNATERAQILAALSVGMDIGVPKALTWTIARVDGAMKGRSPIIKDSGETVDVAADFRGVLADGDAIKAAGDGGIVSIVLIDDAGNETVTSPAFADVGQAELWMNSAVRFEIADGTAGDTDRIRVSVLTVNGHTLSAPCTVIVTGN